MSIEETPDFKTGISAEQFSHPPSEIMDFKVGYTVTRENFTSMLIQSFAISRGVANAQFLFFKWLETKYHFDSTETFNAFLSQGTWDCLSDEERNLFVKAFDGVKVHQTKAERTYDEFKKQLDLISLTHAWNADTFNEAELKEIESISEFRSYVAEMIQKTKEYRHDGQKYD